MRRTSQRLLLLCAPAALALAACGGGGSSDEPEATSAATTQAPATTAASETTETDQTTPTTADTTEDTTDDTTEATTEGTTEETTGGTTEESTEGTGGTGGSSEISSYEDVQPAVIQIETQGTFRDPEVGQASGSGSGSGFIISPDGLAVTNNHVVTGAATLEVFIGGDRDESYNAQVLGVSECSDLAVIKIDAGDDLPSLDWYGGDITAGLDIYAAGFPLGDPEFTLTRGIVTKAEADGDITGTSSIDHTVEHDANTHPGNSGGPIVNSDGEVVAVHYASNNMESGSQRYGIAADLAEPVVEQLQEGDVESLGINGWAFVDEEAGMSGIWVAGVAPGSPAADAGIVAGDIVTSLNGLPMGTDGTFADYCDVIRTSGEGNPIAVEVLRFDTSEVLRGEINGTAPIAPAFSFAEEVSDEVGEDTGAAPETEYESVTDDLNRIVVEVPTAWTDRDTAPFTLDTGAQAPYIAAAPNLDEYINGWTVPGITYVEIPAGASVDAVLTFFGAGGSCADGGRFDYDDGLFTGKYQLWIDCAGTTTDIVTLVAAPPEGDLALLSAQILTDADIAALDHAFQTFNVTGN